MNAVAKLKNHSDPCLFEEKLMTLNSPCLNGEEIEEIKLRLVQRRMCQTMIRKDFELLRIQNSFCHIFKDAQFFSKGSDELCSIEHTIEVAYARSKEEFVEKLFDSILECGCQLAFNYKKLNQSELADINNNAYRLVNLIFQASTFSDDYDGLVYFLKEFMAQFPHIKLPWASAFLNESNKENWMYL